MIKNINYKTNKLFKNKIFLSNIKFVNKKEEKFQIFFNNLYIYRN